MICCPVCLSTDLAICGHCKAWTWRSCPVCGHAVLDIPEIANDEFQANYRKHMPTTGDIVDGILNVEQYTKNRATLKANRLALVGSYISDAASILDIGCGGGYMLSDFKESHHIVGIEVDPLCVEACSSLGVPCYAPTWLAESTEKFDIVMLWHVLEHVYDARKLMGVAIEKLNKGGHLIIEVPISRGFPKRYDGHIHGFTKHSLGVLFKDVVALDIIQQMPGVQTPAYLVIGRLP